MVDLLVDRGFEVAVIDNLVGGREENLAQHRGNPRVRFDGPVDMVTLPPDSPLFKGCGLRLPLRRHRRHRAVHRGARWTTCAPTSTAPSRCWKRLGTPACASSCTPLRPRAMASPPSCPPRGGRHQARVSLCPEQVSRRVRGAPLGPGLRAAGDLDPDVQRVRAAREDHRRLRRGVRVFLAQKLHGKPFTVVGDGTSSATSSTSPTWRRAYLQAAESDRKGEIATSAAAQPPPSTAWSS